jgi:transcriptional regulator with XRE-family HTH domain
MRHFGTKQARLLREHRTRKGLSQMEVSRLLGSKKGTGQHYSNIERSKSGLPPKHIMAICQALEIPVATMIDIMVQDYRENLESIVWGSETTDA